ncbi:MAG: epimerase [Sphingobium sp. 32-64-5]|nr:MAG: epimerase [Sphingobium sp. 32-64-5]
MTGATGFVGAETLDQLLAAGFAVRALTRRPQVERAGVTWVAGALDRPETLDDLVRGADSVLHIAGVVNAPDRAGFEAGNGQGTAHVIAAMERAGVRRLIHVSSLAARERDLSLYCWSKALAEDHVRASALDWTMVRPPAIYGPRDTEYRELLRVARHGVLPVPPQGRSSLIHVHDLARLLVLLCGAAGDGHRGAVWEVDDGTPGGLTHPQLAAAFGSALGRRVRALPLPRRLLMGVARLDAMARGANAKLTPDRVTYMCHPDWVADPASKPPAALWTPAIPHDRGLAEIAARFRR